MSICQEFPLANALVADLLRNLIWAERHNFEVNFFLKKS